MKQYGGKKEGEPEELTHLTEGSFEDTTIILGTKMTPCTLAWIVLLQLST